MLWPDHCVIGTKGAQFSALLDIPHTQAVVRKGYRETIDSYRVLRPFAKQLRHPELWHMNAKSVPRGVALGLGVGVIIPFMHIILANPRGFCAGVNMAIDSLEKAAWMLKSENRKI